MHTVGNTKYFYTWLLEDKAVALLMPRKLNDNGRCKVQDTFNKKVFTLNSQSLKNLLLRLQTPIPITGRCNQRPLNIHFDMQGYLRKVTELGAKLILNGGALWQMVATMVELILNEWLGDIDNAPALYDIVSQLFKASMDSKPNDFDWQIRPSHLQAIESLVEQLVLTLAQNLSEQITDIDQLCTHLDIARQRAQAQPKTSYPYQLFEKHPQNPTDKLEVCQLFVKAFAFNAAADVSTEESSFSIRSLGDDIAQDFLFPIVMRTTPTWINSLFIDLTELLQFDELPKDEIDSPFVVLESLLGKNCEDIVQAVVSKYINLMYYDPCQSLDVSDFAHIMAQFTFCSRSLQRGLFAALLKCLQKECCLKQETLGALMARELCQYARKHYSNDSTVLIAMTFNATAHLASWHASCEPIAQELWLKVFAYTGQCNSMDPLIEFIQQQMRSSCNFDTFYALMQIYAHISQNHLGDSICFPTQTNDQVYTQIRIKRMVQRQSNLELISLMFPYDLFEAINHIATLDALPHYSEALHQIVTGTAPLAFGLEKSRLQPYAKDERRRFNYNLKCSLQLLNRTNEGLWSLGHQLTLSLLAQKFDASSLELYMIALLEMLKSSWASEQFKLEQLDTFLSFMDNSGVVCNAVRFHETVSKPSSQYCTCTELACSLVKAPKPIFLDVALKLLEYMRLTAGKDSIQECYLALVKTMPSNVVMEAIVTSFQKCTLPLSFQLKYYLHVYSKIQAYYSNNLEVELFESISKTLASIGKHHSLHGAQLQFFSRITWSMLKSSNRSLAPATALSFVRNSWRLQLMVGTKQANKCWSYLIKLSQPGVEDNFHYLMQCYILAQDLEWWPTLATDQKESFNEQFKAYIKKYLNSEECSLSDLPIADHPQLLLANKHSFHDLLQKKVNHCDLNEENIAQYMGLIDLCIGLTNTTEEIRLLYQAIKKAVKAPISELHSAACASLIKTFKDNFAQSFVHGLSEGKNSHETFNFYSISQEYFALTPLHYSFFLKCLLQYCLKSISWIPDEKVFALLDNFDKNVSQLDFQLQTDRQQLYASLTDRYKKRQDYESALLCQSIALSSMTPTPNLFTSSFELFAEIAANGSLRTAEKALKQLLHKEFSHGDQSVRENQLSCTLALLRNLFHQNSKVFLDQNLWQTLHNTFPVSQFKKAMTLLPLMLQGAASAIAQESSQPAFKQLVEKIYTLFLKSKVWKNCNIPILLTENCLLIHCKKRHTLHRGINNILHILKSEHATTLDKIKTARMANHFVVAMLPFQQDDSIALTTSCISSLYQGQSSVKQEVYHLAMVEYLTKMHGQDRDAILYDFLKALKHLIMKQDMQDATDPEMDELAESLIRKTLNHLLPRYLNSDYDSRYKSSDPCIRALRKFFSWYSYHKKTTEYLQEKDLSALNRLHYKDFFLTRFKFITFQSGKSPATSGTLCRNLLIVNALLLVALKIYKYGRREGDVIPPPVALFITLFSTLSFFILTGHSLNEFRFRTNKTFA